MLRATRLKAGLEPRASALHVQRSKCADTLSRHGHNRRLTVIIYNLVTENPSINLPNPNRYTLEALSGAKRSYAHVRTSKI